MAHCLQILLSLSKIYPENCDQHIFVGYLVVIILFVFRILFNTFQVTFFEFDRLV